MLQEVLRNQNRAVAERLACPVVAVQHPYPVVVVAQRPVVQAAVALPCPATEVVEYPYQGAVVVALRRARQGVAESPYRAAVVVEYPYRAVQGAVECPYQVVVVVAQCRGGLVVVECSLHRAVLGAVEGSAGRAVGLRLGGHVMPQPWPPLTLLVFVRAVRSVE